MIDVFYHLPRDNNNPDKHELVLNRGDVELFKKRALTAYNELLVEWMSYANKRTASAHRELGIRGWLQGER